MSHEYCLVFIVILLISRLWIFTRVKIQSLYVFRYKKMHTYKVFGANEQTSRNENVLYHLEFTLVSEYLEI